LESGKPDFPFCLAWANESWTGIWNNDHKRVLIEQTYHGIKDYTDHFYENLKAFSDHRYLQINGRLVFVIYKPFNLPKPKEFIEIWSNLAIQNGFKGFYFIAVSNNSSFEIDEILNMGFDAINSNRMLDAQISFSKMKRLITGISRKYFSGKLVLTKYNYSDIINNWIKKEDYREDVIPSILSNWDTSPRSGRRAIILHNSTPELFDKHISEMKRVVAEKQNKVLFLKSWNEWAEGNYVEPDTKFGIQYVEILKNHFFKE